MPLLKSWTSTWTRLYLNYLEDLSLMSYSIQMPQKQQHVGYAVTVSTTMLKPKNLRSFDLKIFAILLALEWIALHTGIVVICTVRLFALHSIRTIYTRNYACSKNSLHRSLSAQPRLGFHYTSVYLSMRQQIELKT